MIGFVLLASASVCTWGQDEAAYLKQADTQAKAGQYRQAVATYQKAISIDPGNSSAYMGLGSAYDHLNLPSDAATAYEKAADLLTTTTPAPHQQTALQNQPQVEARHTQIPSNRPALSAAGRNTGSGALEGLYLMTRFWVTAALRSTPTDFTMAPWSETRSGRAKPLTCRPNAEPILPTLAPTGAKAASSR